MHQVQTRDGVVEIGGSSNGQMAISAMRNMLGKSSLASVYDHLTRQQRATVLFAARIKPTSAIDTPLMQLNIDQREAVRTAIIALADMAKVFAAVPCGREQILGTSKPRQPVAPIATPANEQPDIDDRLASVNKAVANIASQLDARKRA